MAAQKVAFDTFIISIILITIIIIVIVIMAYFVSFEKRNGSQLKNQKLNRLKIIMPVNVIMYIANAMKQYTFNTMIDLAMFVCFWAENAFFLVEKSNGAAEKELWFRF